MQSLSKNIFSLFALCAIVCIVNSAIFASPNAGEVDASFNPLILRSNGAIGRAIAVQPDGKILLGGNFVAANGVLRNSIARFNQDGTLDASFNPPAIQFNLFAVRCSGICAIKLQPDNKILIGGAFGAVNNVPRSGIARLNADGSFDPSFEIVGATSGGINGVVLHIDFQSNENSLFPGISL